MTASKRFIERVVSVLLLGLASVSPNLFPAAQAGWRPLSSLALYTLIPSAALIGILLLLAKRFGLAVLRRRAIQGLLAGLLATIPPEIIRETGFHLGAMPGDLPRLMGVLLLDQFNSGPGCWSDLAGWAYHFWNGAVFGLIFSLLSPRGGLWPGIVYGLFIAIGFMAGPVVRSLGIGSFGLDFKQGYEFAASVTLAHVAFGMTLGILVYRWNKARNKLSFS